MRNPAEILRDADRMIAHLHAELNSKQQVVNKLVATMQQLNDEERGIPRYYGPRCAEARALVEAALKEVGS